MKLTGHKTEAVYRRYAIVAESDLREAGAKLTVALRTGRGPDLTPPKDEATVGAPWPPDAPPRPPPGAVMRSAGCSQSAVPLCPWSPGFPSRRFCDPARKTNGPSRMCLDTC